jgi:hypothetical protein
MKNSARRNQKEIKTKMAAVLDADLKLLSNDLQKILIEDMVTAFENRLSILKNMQKANNYSVELERVADYQVA